MQRRVVITKNIISFAFVGEDHQIDHIPLSEVEFVKEMKVFDAPTEDDKQEEESSDDPHKLQIATLPTGYNSGRVYYLATRDRDEFTRLLAKLSRLAKAARKRAEAHTLFRKMQLKVRKRYEANPVQWLMALMIMAVRLTLGLSRLLGLCLSRCPSLCLLGCLCFCLSDHSS